MRKNHRHRIHPQPTEKQQFPHQKARSATYMNVQSRLNAEPNPWGNVSNRTDHPSQENRLRFTDFRNSQEHRQDHHKEESENDYSMPKQRHRVRKDSDHEDRRKKFKALPRPYAKDMISGKFEEDWGSHIRDFTAMTQDY